MKHDYIYYDNVRTLNNDECYFKNCSQQYRKELPCYQCWLEPPSNEGKPEGEIIKDTNIKVNKKGEGKVTQEEVKVGNSDKEITMIKKIHGNL